jgi:hypothetical protein
MPDAPDLDPVLAATKSHADEFLGWSEDEARKLADELGFTLRVVPPGGAVSLDLRPRRMTVIVERGATIRAFGG